MRVKSLSYRNFRNLADGILIPCEGVNVICGDNAQGKTNLIEAIWLFCGGHSFRSVKDSEVVKWNTAASRLELEFFGQDRDQHAVLTIDGSKKRAVINGVEKKSTSAMIEKFCAVVFSPEHLNLIKRGPSERRRFIDSAICREKLQNAVILSKYNRMLNQRNALLKDIPKKPGLKETLPVWDAQLVHYGAELTRRRLDYAEQLSNQAAQFHSGISHGSEQLQIRYRSSVSAQPGDSVELIGEKLERRLEENRDSDIRFGVTASGPHRDDIDILINGKAAKSFASQGQQRSAVLSLKLAEAAVLRERMGEEPVVLLDDVLSELDFSRQDFLLNELKNTQVFITCCEKSDRELLKSGSTFTVSGGRII